MPFRTEAQARRTWCPYSAAPVIPGSEVVGNRGADSDQAYRNTLCLGAHCMAWRWADASHEAGYCGAFGRPEEPAARRTRPDRSDRFSMPADGIVVTPPPPEDWDGRKR